MKPKRLMLLLALALVVPESACAGRRRPPDLVEDALAFAQADRTRAIQLLEDAVAAGEGGADATLYMLHAGEQNRLLGDVDRARRWFQGVLANSDVSDERMAAEVGIALIRAMGGADAESLALLQDADDKALLPTMAADRHLVLAGQAAQQNDVPAVREHTRRALQHAAEDDAVLERVRAALERLVDEPDAPVLVEAEGDGTLLARAERALADGDPERARRLAEKVVEAPADEEEALVAHYLLERLDAAPVDPRTIGVILPLSGRFETAGRQVKEALEEGYRGAAGSRKLVFADSGEDATTAVAALERLVLEEGAVAVIGPLRSELADPVGRAADAMRVPLVSLSQQAQSPEVDRPWVFQGMVTAEMQADALVAFLVDKGMGAFAVFAPDTGYGRSATEAFEQAVEAHGARIAIVEFYDPAATDLIPFAQKLGQKDYEARKSELWKLRREVEEKGGDPSKVVLPPKIDFDAIFIPDSPARIPLATAALAYEEFPIGEFRTTRDGRTIPLLGLNGWNDPALVARGNVYVRSSYFTATWYDADEAAQAFAAAYKEATGRSPSSLEAIAWDTGRLVAAAAEGDARTREDFRAALSSAEAVGTGGERLGFDPEERRAEHRIRILTMTETAIVPADIEPTDGDE